MDDLRKARLMVHTPVGRQTARNLGLPTDEAEIQAAEFSSDHWKTQARDKGKFASGSGGSGKSADAADEKKKKEPWEMTPDEYERSFHGATFGDWYMTPDGKFGQMRGHGSLGSGRVGVVGVDGERIGWYDRSELRLVHKDQRSSAETDAASKWIAEVSEKVSGLKKEHESLLLNKKITDRLKNAVSSGQMSQSQYDAAKAKGTVLSDADYAKAVGIEKQIEDARNAPIAVPVNKKHRELVSSALAEGKTVPPEVLANYPDLADKAKEKPARITTKPKPVKNHTEKAKAALDSFLKNPVKTSHEAWKVANAIRLMKSADMRKTAIELGIDERHTSRIFDKPYVSRMIRAKLEKMATQSKDMAEPVR